MMIYYSGSVGIIGVTEENSHASNKCPDEMWSRRKEQPTDSEKASADLADLGAARPRGGCSRIQRMNEYANGTSRNLLLSFLLLPFRLSTTRLLSGFDHPFATRTLTLRRLLITHSALSLLRRFLPTFPTLGPISRPVTQR